MTESNNALTVYNYKPEGSPVNSENNFFVFGNGKGEKVIFSRGSDQNVYVCFDSAQRKEQINISAQFGRRHFAQAFDVLADEQGNVTIAIAISSKGMQSTGKVYISGKLKTADLFTMDWNAAKALFTEFPPAASFNPEIKNLVFGQNGKDDFLIVDAKRVGDLAGVDHYIISYSKDKVWNKVALPNDVKNPIQVIFGMHGKPAIWSVYKVGHDQVLQWTAPALFSGYPNDVSQPYENLPANIHYIRNIKKPGNKFDDLFVAGDGLFVYRDKSNTLPVKLVDTGKNIRKLDCLVSSATEQQIILLNSDKTLQLYTRNLADNSAVAVAHLENAVNFCVVQQDNQKKIAVLVSNSGFSIQFYELKDNALVKCDKEIQLDPIWNVPPLTAAELNDVIAKNGPNLYFHSKEQFHLSKVDFYLKNVGCWDENKKNWLHRPGTLWDAEKNDLKPFVFPEATEENKKKIFLKIPEDPKDYLIAPEVLKAGKPGPEGEAYVHAKFSEQEDSTDIQFWFFYPFNGAGAAYIWLPTESSERVDLDPLGTHEGDWEHVTIRIDNYTMQFKGAWMSQHGDHIWIDGEKVQKENGKPIFYASRHGHANYATAGAHLAPDFEVEHVCHFGLRNDTEKSNRYIPCSSQHRIVAAAFLENPPVEPNWLQFNFRWGGIYFFAQGKVEDVIKDNLPVTLRVIVGLLPGGFLFNNLLLQSLFPNIVYNKLLPDGEKYSSGPSGPKLKGAWAKDESLGG